MLSLDRFLLLGVVHLLPLPGGPAASPGFAAVRARALADARAILQGGAHGLIVENFGDAPFAKTSVEPHVVAAMAEITGAIRQYAPHAILGVNVLRNDARAALGIASVAAADFVRINVLSGAYVTDQGVIEGDAHAWLRYRREIGAENVHIAADVHVKHAVPLAPVPIGDAAHDLVRRAGAAALIVTGRSTGGKAESTDVHAVRKAEPGVPVWLGSGVTVETVREWRAIAHGAIVGTALHAEGDLRAPIDVARVAAMVAAVGLA
jgi:membrane complex biogenesis BtpA family protein